MKFAPAFGWAIVILTLSLMPAVELPKSSLWQVDKIVHIAFYGILFLLTSYGLKKQYAYTSKRFITLAIMFTACFSYGLFIEMLQDCLVSDRFFDKYDLLANGVGCVVGSFISKYYF